MSVFADRRPFGTVRAQVERVLKAWFLTYPDTILYFSDNTTAHTTVGTDAALDGDITAVIGSTMLTCGFRFLHHRRWQHRHKSGTASSDTTAFQESPTIDT
jgi:hypothetical protein